MSSIPNGCVHGFILPPIQLIAILKQPADVLVFRYNINSPVHIIYKYIYIQNQTNLIAFSPLGCCCCWCAVINIIRFGSVPRNANAPPRQVKCKDRLAVYYWWTVRTTTKWPSVGAVRSVVWIALCVCIYVCCQ